MKVYKDLMNNNEWSEASKLASEILNNNNIVPSLEKEVTGLHAQIEDEQEKEVKIASEFKDIDKLIKITRPKKLRQR